VPCSSRPDPSLSAASHLFKRASSPTIDGYSYAALEADATTAYQDVAAKEQSDKATRVAYQRHINAYGEWWENYQARAMAADPSRCYIPAFPITCPKVVMFLQYESSRPKKVRRRIPVRSAALTCARPHNSVNAVITRGLRPSRLSAFRTSSRQSLHSSTGASQTSAASSTTRKLRNRFAQTPKSVNLSQLQVTTSRSARRRRSSSRLWVPLLVRSSPPSRRVVLLLKPPYQIHTQRRSSSAVQSGASMTIRAHDKRLSAFAIERCSSCQRPWPSGEIASVPSSGRTCSPLMCP